MQLIDTIDFDQELPDLTRGQLEHISELAIERASEST
jgi:hypothetical protein